jgi:hypothetical protein
MITYWFSTPISYWWPLALAIVFAVGAVVAVTLTLARRAEEPDADSIAMFYGIGLGLVAISEFMMYLDLAFGWSLAAAFSMATGLVTFFAIAAVVVAVVAIGAALVMQFREESGYRHAHQAY